MTAWDPFLSVALSQYGARVLANGPEIGSENAIVMIARRGFAAEHPALLKAVYDALLADNAWEVAHKDAAGAGLGAGDAPAGWFGRRAWPARCGADRAGWAGAGAADRPYRRLVCGGRHHSGQAGHDRLHGGFGTVTFAALDSVLVAPLFATDAMRALLLRRGALAAMLAAEAALARAEASVGLVSADLAPAIEAIGPLDAGEIGRKTAVAGVPTIPFVKAVQALLPAELERGFHKGATTQDILDTALVLQMRGALAALEGDLVATLDGLAQLAVTHRGTPCVGRTYGQHAAPVSFGYKAAVWLAGVAEIAEALPGLRSRVLVASLGGPVGTLASLAEKGPAVLEAFARELGLDATPIAWHVRRARMAEAGVLAGAGDRYAGEIGDRCRASWRPLRWARSRNPTCLDAAGRPPCRTSATRFRPP